MKNNIKQICISKKDAFPTLDEFDKLYEDIVKNRKLKKIKKLFDKNFNDVKFNLLDGKDITNVSVDFPNEDNDDNKEEVIKDKVRSCMIKYYQLIDTSDSEFSLLDTFIYDILKFFRLQEHKLNKEMAILKNSGLIGIKIRYKRPESLIKKLINIGFEEISVLDC